MKKKWKMGLALASVLVIVLGAVLYIYQIKTLKKEHSATLDDSLWEVALERVSDTWNGRFDLSDTHFKKNCPELARMSSSESVIPQQLLGCRSKLFHCYYDKRLETLAYKKKRFPMKILFKDKENSSQSNASIELHVGSEKKKFELSDHCRMAKLPDGFYRGRFLQERYDWHTSGLHYYIDKYLVRNIDIALWKKVAIDRAFLPSINLTSDEMASYCASRNAQVLSAKVHDALTYHHGRESKDKINEVAPGKNTSPYPFGPRVIDSPSYHAQKNNRPASRESCQMIYSQECLKIMNNSLSLFSVGWSEITELLGGPLEYVLNSKYPRKNLVASSYYFPLSSQWHQAGKRAYWNGNDHHIKDFNFFVEAPRLEDKQKKNLAVGFRCMRLEWP